MAFESDTNACANCEPTRPRDRIYAQRSKGPPLSISRCITHANEGPALLLPSLPSCRVVSRTAGLRVHGDACEVKIAYIVIALLISAAQRHLFRSPILSPLIFTSLSAMRLPRLVYKRRRHKTQCLFRARRRADGGMDARYVLHTAAQFLRVRFTQPGPT